LEASGAADGRDMGAPRCWRWPRRPRYST